MRSSNVDVASVALSFGGGGHLRAAGCTIYAPVEEAKAQLLAAIGKAL
jgi:phosphoesterase RecJ-like protein